MSVTKDYIRRVIERAHLHREMFSEAKVPDSLSRLKIIVFFGDPTSELLLSSVILPRLTVHDYLIVVSWPGHSGLYGYADEYWTIKDESALADLVAATTGHENGLGKNYERILLGYFDRVVSGDELFAEYYDRGFTKKFTKEFDAIEQHLPSIPAVNMAWDRNVDMGSRKKVLLRPSKYMRRWRNGKSINFVSTEDFWVSLVEKLLDRGLLPVILHDYSTHDISYKFSNKVAYITDLNLMAILGVMRACDCTLDVFNGLSRHAIVARSPYLICDERQRYLETNEYQIDDLFGKQLPKSVVYTFAPMTTTESANLVIHAMLNRMDEILKGVARKELPSTVEQVKRFAYDDLFFRIPKAIETDFISVPKNFDI